MYTIYDISVQDKQWSRRRVMRFFSISAVSDLRGYLVLMVLIVVVTNGVYRTIPVIMYK